MVFMSFLLYITFCLRKAELSVQMVRRPFRPSFSPNLYRLSMRIGSYMSSSNKANILWFELTICAVLSGCMRANKPLSDFSKSLFISVYSRCSLLNASSSLITWTSFPPRASTASFISLTLINSIGSQMSSVCVSTMSPAMMPLKKFLVILFIGRPLRGASMSTQAVRLPSLSTLIGARRFAPM